MRRSIPLQQVHAFDAAARWLSFSRAAQDLNVQQPAVSRQVASLEAFLGTQLFLRTKPRLTLTEDGQILAKAVAQGFDAIHDGLSALRARQGNETITVSASIGFTSLFLLPRLAEFQAMAPEIKLQIITRDQNEDFDPTTCDVVIVFGPGGLPQMKSEVVFREAMIAICHPDLLPDGKPFALKELAEQNLLHMTSEDHRGDWNRYVADTGQVIPPPPAHDGFLSYMVYLRAIQNKLGIGIGWQPMMSEYLANGSLVRACLHESHTSRGYFSSITPSGTLKSGAELFQEWISGLVKCPR